MDQHSSVKSRPRWIWGGHVGPTRGVRGAGGGGGGDGDGWDSGGHGCGGGGGDGGGDDDGWDGDSEVVAIVMVWWS